MTDRPMLRSIRNPAIRRKFEHALLRRVEDALVETHQTIYRQYGWPSRELEMVNRVAGFLFPLLRERRAK